MFLGHGLGSEDTLDEESASPKTLSSLISGDKRLLSESTHTWLIYAGYLPIIKYLKKNTHFSNTDLRFPDKVVSTENWETQTQSGQNNS